MAIKTDHVLIGIAGGGFTLIGVYLLYSEYEKNKHVDEFIEKTKKAQAAYQSAIDADNVEQAQSIAEFYEQLMHEEVAIIESEGTLEKVIRRLAQLGIIIVSGGALYIGYKIIKYFMEKYPPKNYQPPTPPTQPVPANVSAAESAYRKLSRYLKGLLNSFAEVPEYMTEESWAGLPRWAILAIAAAAAILIALSWGTLSPALVPIAAMAV